MDIYEYVRPTTEKLVKKLGDDNQYQYDKNIKKWRKVGVVKQSFAQNR